MAHGEKWKKLKNEDWEETFCFDEIWKINRGKCPLIIKIMCWLYTHWRKQQGHCKYRRRKRYLREASKTERMAVSFDYRSVLDHILYTHQELVEMEQLGAEVRKTITQATHQREWTAPRICITLHPFIKHFHRWCLLWSSHELFKQAWLIST